MGHHNLGEHSATRIKIITLSTGVLRTHSRTNPPMPLKNSTHRSMSTAAEKGKYVDQWPVGFSLRMTPALLPSKSFVKEALLLNTIFLLQVSH